jgi:hypothetical protein
MGVGVVVVLVVAVGVVVAVVLVVGVVVAVVLVVGVVVGFAVVPPEPHPSRTVTASTFIPRIETTSSSRYL